MDDSKVDIRLPREWDANQWLSGDEGFMTKLIKARIESEEESLAELISFASEILQFEILLSVVMLQKI